MKKRVNPWRTRSNIFVIAFVIVMAMIVLYQLIFIPSLRSETGLPSPMVIHEGEFFGFSIQLPQSWVIMEFQDNIHDDPDLIAEVTRAGKSLPGVLIANKNIPSGEIRDAINWGMSRIMNCDSYQPGTPVDVTISGIPGIKFNYSCIRRVSFIPNREGRVLCNDYYLINDQLAYALTFCAEEKNWAEVEKVFDEMISSFSLK